jgi:RNA polymerase sigma factor (TIGR02999 family)
MTAPPKDITELLLAWRRGNEDACEALAPLVYQELRRIARRHMRGEQPDHTLQTTALANEAWLKLIDIHRIDWHDRAHFFAMASRLMRRVLVDAARARRSRKRGSGTPDVPLDSALKLGVRTLDQVVELDDALTGLASLDQRKSQVVELRFFGGLSVEETADALKVSMATVARDWNFARTWLRRELSGRSRRRSDRVIGRA